MINKIGYKNIKVFKQQQWFDLAPITILTGPNNSGKSTIQKMLILLVNSFFKDKKQEYHIDSLKFTGDIVKKIGGFSSVISYDSKKSEKIIFSFEIKDDFLGVLECYLSYEKDNSGNGRLCKMEFFKKHDKVITFESILAEKYYQKKGYKKDTKYSSQYTIKFIGKEENRNFILNIFSNQYIWQCTNKDNYQYFVNLYRNGLIYLKNKGFEQDKLNELNEKISSRQNLNQEEQKLKEKYEREKGIEFNSYAASELMEMGGSYSWSWNIWDKEKKEVYLFDDKAKKISEIFNQPDSDLLLPSKLSEIVLGKENILHEDVNDNEIYSQIKKQLIENNIFTVEDFKRAYISLEKEIIEAIIRLNAENKFENPFGDYDDSVSPKSFHQYFSGKVQSLTSSLKEYLKNSDDIVARLLFSELKSENKPLALNKAILGLGNNTKRNAGNTLVKGDESAGKTKDVRKREELIKSINYISKNIFGYMDSLLTGIESFMNRLSFSLQNQNKIIKRHYLNNDTGNIDSIFFDRGKKYVENNNSFGSKEDKFIKKWLEEFRIADELIVKKIMAEWGSQKSELIGVSYFLRKKRKDYPLGDNGFGINYFVLLLLQIISSKGFSYRKTMVVLEEPESNMHPKFQSKLADLLVDAKNTFDIEFVIETHSEYLIRKLQYLTAKNEIHPDVTGIYYFHEPNRVPKGEKQIKEIKIEEDGSLSDQFGPGFFDEATNIKFDLLRLKLN